MPGTQAELDATMPHMSRVEVAQDARVNGHILNRPWKEVVDQFNRIQDVPERLKWLDIMAKRPEGAHLGPQRNPVAPPAGIPALPNFHPDQWQQPAAPDRPKPPVVPFVPRPRQSKPGNDWHQPRQESYISSFDRLVQLVQEQP